MFVSKPVRPEGYSMEARAIGEPSLPAAFCLGDERFEVCSLVRQWRSTKTDRGDVYLKRHWFEFVSQDGRLATVYFDRGARRGAPRWYLYSIR